MEFPGASPRSAGAAGKRLECKNPTTSAAPGHASAVAGRGIETRYLPVAHFTQCGIRRRQIPIRIGNMCKGEAGEPEGQALAHRFQHRLLGAPKSDEGTFAGVR